MPNRKLNRRVVIFFSKSAFLPGRQRRNADVPERRLRRRGDRERAEIDARQLPVDDPRRGVRPRPGADAIKTFSSVA
jgi:hypothetical protein